MENPCYRCGASVGEGIAFCPHCNAPQIRVAAAEAIERPGVAPDISISPPTSETGSTPTAAIEWSQALPAAAWAGLIAAVLVVTQFGGFGLGTLSAGFLAVVLYRRRNPAFNPTPGMGARLGVLSGALAFAILTVLLAARVAVSHSGGQIRQTVMEAVEQSAARNSNQQQAQQALEFLKTPDGFALMIVLGLILAFVAFLIGSGVGGAIGAALLRRRDQR